MTTFNLDWQVDTSQIQRLVSQLQATKTGAESAAKAMEGVTTGVNKAGAATHAFSLQNTGVIRELSVMLGESLRGNWTRLEQSMTVLANRTGLLAMAFTPLGAALGLTVGALGLLAYASVKGAEEQNKLTFAIQNTGNYAGTTSANLRQLALDVGSASENFKGAKEAVMALTESGRFTESQVESIGKAIASASDLGGEKVNGLVKEFVKLKEEPVKASAELNKQYHFLTAAIYEQIIALDKQGKSDEAAAVAIDALAKHETDAANTIKGNMGTLQRLAVEGANAFHKWWDEVLGIGRKSDANSALADIDKQIAFAKKQVSIAQGKGGAGQAEQNAVDALVAQRAELTKMKTLVDDNAAAQGRLAQTEQKRIDGLSYLNSHEGQYTSKLQMEREELGRLVQAAKDAGKSQQDIDAITAGFWARHKQPKVPGMNADNNAAIESVRGDIEQQRVQYDIQVTNLRTALAKQEMTQQEFDRRKLAAQLKMYEADMADALKAKNIAASKGVNYKAEAQHWQNEYDKYAADMRLAEAQYQKNETDHANKLKSIWDGIATSLDRSTQSQLLSMRKQTRQMFATTNERAVEDRHDATNTRFDEEKSRLIEKMQAERASASDLQKSLDQLEAKRADALSQEDAEWQKRLDAQHEWSNGAKLAFKQYVEDAQNAASQTKDLFTSAFQSMEDALVNFSTTGKFNFADLAKSIITDIVRMEAKAAESKILSYLGSMFGVGGGGGAVNMGTTSGEAASAFWARGGVFQQGLRMFATGEVVGGPRFFNNGAGLMGEQGPEAIMPLTRGADGKLGVVAQGGSGGAVTVHGGINVSVHGGMTNEQTGQIVATAVAESLRHMPAVADGRIHNATRNGGLLYGH